MPMSNGRSIAIGSNKGKQAHDTIAAHHSEIWPTPSLFSASPIFNHHLFHIGNGKITRHNNTAWRLNVMSIMRKPPFAHDRTVDRIYIVIRHIIVQVMREIAVTRRKWRKWRKWVGVTLVLSLRVSARVWVAGKVDAWMR